MTLMVLVVQGSIIRYPRPRGRHQLQSYRHQPRLGQRRNQHQLQCHYSHHQRELQLTNRSRLQRELMVRRRRQRSYRLHLRTLQMTRLPLAPRRRLRHLKVL